MHHDDIPTDDQPRGIAACYLPFDEAQYRHGTVPCQLLAATFSFSGVSYVVEEQGGFCIPVPRTYIRALMEDGKYVWVCKNKAESVFSVAGPVLRLRLSANLSGYTPIHRTLVSEQLLSSALQGISPMPRLKGRKRLYYRDGTVGPSSNLATRAKITSPREDDGPIDWSDK